MTPEEIARDIVEYAADRKALEIVQLDLRGIIGYTDYFVICTGRSDRQAKGIHDAILYGLKTEHSMLPRKVEGLSEARWILMDDLNAAVHVLTPHMRSLSPHVHLSVRAG